jgi:hypothetical protein
MDLTPELCGVEIVKPRLPGYIKPTSEVISLENKKFWGAGIKQVNIKDGEVLVKEGIAGYPLLVRKGNVYFSAMGCSPESMAYFSAIVNYISRPPVALSENSGMRILESVRKNGVLCLSFWGKGKAALHLDINNAGLNAGACRVKDIVTGRVIGDFEAGRLSAGIPIEIKYLNQPFILAIGPKEATEVFKGIYPSEDVFEGMTETVTIENPEVPLSVPDRPGIKVGVYHGGLGAVTIMRALAKEQGINCYSLPRLDTDALAKTQVVIIPQAGSPVFFNRATNVVKSWVEGGGGLLLLHDAVGYRGHTPVFPEACKALTNPRNDTVKVVKAHPVTAGFNIGDVFVHAYADHIALQSGEKAEALVKDEKGNAVVVALEIGKGRVILDGMLPGYASKVRGAIEGEEKEPAGGELKMLINSVKWLAKETR